MWLDQFEFAGFYAAKEKGFYEKAGLDVDIKKFTINTNVTEEVLNGNADFGTNSTSLIIEKSKGKDIVILGTVFQSSPLILLALKNSNIDHIQDVKNKKVMLTKEQETFATLQALLVSKNIDLKDLNVIEHTFNVDDLINEKTDLMLAYTTNEPFILKEKGYESKIFHPKDYGFDFYEEMIFTSKEFLAKNPKLVENFYKATIEGWYYAFEHIDEIAKLIYEKYNPQNKSLKSLIYEANEMKKLVYDENGKIGTITKEKINIIINVYKLMGLQHSDINFNELFYNKHLNGLELTKEELEYLKKKEKIRLCVDPDWMPFEKVENNKHIGISADYLKILEKKIGTKLELIPTKTWSESLKLGEQRQCDIFSLVMSTPQREKFLDFTKPYLKMPLVLATDINTPFIDTMEQIKTKKLAIVKNYAYAEILKIKYPGIDFLEVNNIDEGLKKVLNNEVFGFIGTLATVGYQIQKEYIGQLKITGKFNETWNLGIGTRNDEPLLNTIFNKAIESIPQSEIQSILNRWISINYQKEMDYTFLYIILAISILSFLAYRQYLLNKLNTQLNIKVAQEIEKNEEKNRILIKQSRMASMGEMLENIAHQWRQPLSIISIAATGLKVKKDIDILTDEDIEEAIEHIRKSTTYLSNTIDDFRTFFNENKEKKEVQIEKIVDKCFDLLGTKVIKYDINFVKNIESFHFYTLENELIQTMMNILLNAKDALVPLDDEKYVFINISKNNSQVIIEILDNANGIKEDIMDKIFEPYFTTKHQYKGTGIGLYMTKQLVEKHLNGSIEVKNEEFEFNNKSYKGAKFTILLPL